MMGLRHRLMYTVVGAIVISILLIITAALISVGSNQTNANETPCTYAPSEAMPIDIMLPEMAFAADTMLIEAGVHAKDFGKTDASKSTGMRWDYQHRGDPRLSNVPAANYLRAEQENVASDNAQIGAEGASVPEVSDNTTPELSDRACAPELENRQVGEMKISQTRRLQGSGDRVGSDDVEQEGAMGTEKPAEIPKQYIHLDLDAPSNHPSITKEALNGHNSWLYYINERTNKTLQLRIVQKMKFMFIVKSQQIKNLKQHDLIISVVHISGTPEEISIVYRTNGHMQRVRFRRNASGTYFKINRSSPKSWKRYSLGCILVYEKPILRIQLENSMGDSLIMDGVESRVVLHKDDEDELNKIECHIPLNIPQTGIMQPINVVFENKKNYRTWELVAAERICTGIRMTNKAETKECNAQQLKEAEYRIKLLPEHASLQRVVHVLVRDSNKTDEMVAYTVLYHPETATLFAVRYHIIAKNGIDHVEMTVYDMPITKTYPTTFTITPYDDLQWSKIHPMNAGIMEFVDNSKMHARIEPYGTMAFPPYALHRVDIDMGDRQKMYVRPRLLSRTGTNLQAVDSPGYVDVHKRDDGSLLIDVIYVVALPGKRHTDVVRLRLEVIEGVIHFVKDNATGPPALRNLGYCEGEIAKHSAVCIVKQILTQSQGNEAKVYTFIYDPKNAILSATSQYLISENSNWRIDDEIPAEKYNQTYIYVRPTHVTVDQSGTVSLQEKRAGDVTATLDGTYVRLSVRPEGRSHDMPFYHGYIEVRGTQVLAPYLESDDGNALIDKYVMPSVSVEKLGESDAKVHVDLQLQLADGAIRPMLRLKFLCIQNTVYLENIYERRDHRSKWNPADIELPDDNIADISNVRKLSRVVQLGKDAAIYMIALDVVYQGDLANAYTFLYNVHNGHIQAMQTTYKRQPEQARWTKIGGTISYYKPISGVRYLNRLV